MNSKLISKKYLITALVVFGILLTSLNCRQDDAVELNAQKVSQIETVSFEEAKAFYELNKPKLNLSKDSNPLILTPHWNSLKYDDVAYTEAKLTSAKSTVNRPGNYTSELQFIKINGMIRNVIFTVYKDVVDTDGNLVNGRVFFNDLEGRFLDGYIIEDGLFKQRYVINNPKQTGSFLPTFWLQNKEDNEDCWNTDTLDEFPGGVLDTVNLGVITSSSGNDSGGGEHTQGGHSSSYNWYYSTGGGTSFGSYINGSMWLHAMPPGTTAGLSSGQLASAAAAILIASPTDPDDDGKCPPGYQINYVTGKCDPLCVGGKLFNSATYECECPDNMAEDRDGNCAAKPCPGDPVANPEIAPQKGRSGVKGALQGCTRYGSGCFGFPGGRTKYHGGIDIKNPYGAPVYALFDGEIISNYPQPNLAGYVTRIRSELPNGQIIVYQYFHLQKDSRLPVGTKVKAGEVVAIQGDSGNLKNAILAGSVESHVHIQMNVYDGSGDSYDYYANFKENPVNPSDYLNTKFDSEGNKTENNCN